MLRRKSSMLRILLVGVGFYIVAVVLLSLAQRRMMYFPSRGSQRELEREAAQEGFKPWRNGEGNAIGWHRAAQSAAAKWCVLVIHGNAGNATHRFHYADSFQPIAPMDFYVLEYPGYGGRGGAPSQTNILRAAEEALNCLPAEAAVFLISESLGTGAAAYLAGRHQERIRGALLIAPYNNMTAVAQKHMPLFPVRAILRDRYPADTWLATYRGPLAVLLAGRDTVIPTELGRALFDGYEGPKKLWIEPELGHNDLHMPRAGVWNEVVAFWSDPRF